jgi:hypothetical protein
VRRCAHLAREGEDDGLQVHQPVRGVRRRGRAAAAGRGADVRGCERGAQRADGIAAQACVLQNRPQRLAQLLRHGRRGGARRGVIQHAGRDVASIGDNVFVCDAAQRGAQRGARGVAHGGGARRERAGK